MTEKPMHSSSEKNGFKKPDRADRVDRQGTHNSESPKTGSKPSGGAPNPNDDSHTPKIVPWK